MKRNKRYLRLKDGRIIDRTQTYVAEELHAHPICVIGTAECIYPRDIVCQGNKVRDIIKVGDVVQQMNQTIVIDSQNKLSFVIAHSIYIKKVFTKHSKGYRLVAQRRGTGELKLV